MNTLPTPVAIVAPDEPTFDSIVELLIELAVIENKIPFVIRRSHLPWFNDDAPERRVVIAETILGMVAKHSGGLLWVVQDEGGGTAKDWPRVEARWARAWQRVAGVMPSRIRRGRPSDWQHALDGVRRMKNTKS